jgi:hypothetical protein
MKADQQKKLIGQYLDADENTKRHVGRYGRCMPKPKRPEPVYGEDF